MFIRAEFRVAPSPFSAALRKPKATVSAGADADARRYFLGDLNPHPIEQTLWVKLQLWYLQRLVRNQFYSYVGQRHHRGEICAWHWRERSRRRPVHQHVDQGRQA
jgi:hypothetical protein